jgi:hypothetical protein
VTAHPTIAPDGRNRGGDLDARDKTDDNGQPAIEGYKCPHEEQDPTREHRDGGEEVLKTQAGRPTHDSKCSEFQAIEPDKLQPLIDLRVPR